MFKKIVKSDLILYIYLYIQSERERERERERLSENNSKLHNFYSPISLLHRSS